MGLEKIHFFWYARRIGGWALIACGAEKANRNGWLMKWVVIDAARNQQNLDK